ncbi:MAG: hypothetical protein ACRD2Z_07445 [Thermoanaerobaculia bacterium]
MAERFMSAIVPSDGRGDGRPELNAVLDALWAIGFDDMALLFDVMV